MPTYEYSCTSCGEHHEVVQSFHDEPLTTCPNCGGPLRKVFGSIGVVFKGSGFYKNDSRPADKADKKAEPVKASSEAKSSDMPAAKKDGKTASGSPAPVPASGSSDKAAS
jgi:putative FmdB family regulatory protein